MTVYMARDYPASKHCQFPDPIVDVSVPILAEIINPLRNFVWCRTPRGADPRDAVEVCIYEQRFRDKPVSIEEKGRLFIAHCERIAYLVMNRATDPVEIDVGVPILGYPTSNILLDGNHRLAAAIYRGDKWIQATIAGQIDYARELLKLNRDAVKALYKPVVA